MTSADVAARLDRIEAALELALSRQPWDLWRDTEWIRERYKLGRSQLYRLEQRGVIEGSQGGRTKLWFVPDVHAYVTGQVLPTPRNLS